MAGGMLAQTFTARLTGTVTDPSASPINAAAVTAKNAATNAATTATTNDSGVYVMPILPPGEYEVSVDAAGFQKRLQKQVRLEVNQSAVLDFALTVASVATEVIVTDEAPVLQTESGNVGTTINSQTIDELPLVQRDVMAVVRLAPGVIAKGQVGDARGGRGVFNSNFSVGGGRTSTNEVLLDGAVNTIGDFNGVAFSPPPDSVQEFRVETNSFSAEFGRTGGGAVNIVTKSGGNKYHGTLYYYLQNDFLNANSFVNNRFGTPRPVLRRHQYGLTVGGPVSIPKLYNGKNKTFFFTAFEGRRETDPVRSISSVPTELERAGDFSQTNFLSAAGPQLIQIYDPATSRVVGGVRSRTLFPENKIPASRFDPVAVNMMKEYPLANRAGSSITGRQNYLFSGDRTYARDLFTTRVDHLFSERHRLFGRFSQQKSLDTQPSVKVRFTNSNNTKDSFYNTGIDDTFQITPRLFHVFRYMYVRYRANLVSNTLGFDPTTLGLPNYIRDSANVLFYPNVTVGGGIPDLGGTAFNNQPRDTQGIQSNLVYAQGKHTLKMGGEYRLYRFYPYQIANPTGIYSFNQFFTSNDQLGTARPEQGLGLASFLLGFGSFTYEKVEPLSAFQHYVGSYFQDDWKVNSRLTLNLGLRWETETGTGEAHDRLTYFDPQAQSPAGAGFRGALKFTGGNNPRTIRETNWMNFGPRLGFAYRLNNKTAVRGGYGIFYLPIGLETAIVTTPFNFNVIADVFNADYTPRTTLRNPFPNGITRPNSASRLDDGSFRLGNNANIVLRDQPNSYVQQWNFAVARQIGRTSSFDVTYFGSRGVRLPTNSLELNQIDPKNLAQGGSYLTELVNNPFFGQGLPGLLSQQRIPRMQLLKPHPQFASPTTANAFGGSLIYFRPPVADSIYHAVTFRYDRKFTRGFSLGAHYTISKVLETGGGGNGIAFLDPAGIRDIYNIRLERSVGSFDVPQRAVITFSSQLPFGRGKKFFNRSKLANRFIGNWQFFSNTTLQAGLPINVGGPDISRIAGASPSRASVVPGVNPRLPLSESIANSRDWSNACGCTKPWFNPAAFRTTPEFQIPNGPRFLPNIREGWLRGTDVNLQKSVFITERIRMSLQLRAFNVLNQVSFGGPSVITVGQANFGSAGGVVDNARRAEIGAKIYF
jgi:outer membrane receptor protein involved in Fe transport